MQFRLQRGRRTSSSTQGNGGPKVEGVTQSKGATHGDGVRPDGEFGVMALGEENRYSQFGR